MTTDLSKLNERDMGTLTHIAGGGVGTTSRNRLIKLFKKAGASAQCIHGELAVTYNSEVIHFARGDVDYGQDNAFSREVKLMASNMLARKNG